MAGLKTQPTNTDALQIIEAIENEDRRNDCLTLLELMKKTTKQEPVVWGESMIGFGSYHYKYDSGREGDWFITGFSPRKQNISIYILPDLKSDPALLESLGKFNSGASCLYVKKLDDIDLKVLKKMIQAGAKRIKALYG